jgi:hypothetical protein
MFNKIIADLKRIFEEHDFTETLMNSPELFVEDTPTTDENGHYIRYTMMTDLLPIVRHFKIKNTSENIIAHICIDGGFIKFGQKKYDHKSAKFADGRPDSIIFDQNNFIFLEIKVNQEDISWDKEDSKWKRFFEGANKS